MAEENKYLIKEVSTPVQVETAKTNKTELKWYVTSLNII